jgi:histidine triad (HIT) family protein
MEDCIFCKIINGEIPSDKIYEDDKILAFKDINPAARVHVLVIPKQHIENIMGLNEENNLIILDIHKAIQNVAEALNIDKSGFRLINNCGSDGGQTVQHLHYHMIGGQKLGEKLL